MDDAQAFCEWLTKEDRRKGKLEKDERYRLPSDHEWSCAVGIGKEEDAVLTPSAKNGKIADIYPWGKKFPPPKGAGNFYGEECKYNPKSVNYKEPIEGYDDGIDRTAPVGSFEGNGYGLFDMGGNVQEWCEDWISNSQRRRVLRGGSWGGRSERFLSSSNRFSDTPARRYDSLGFRLVVAGDDEKPNPKPALTIAKPTTAPAPANTPTTTKAADTPPEPKSSNLAAIPGLKTRLDGYLKAQSTQVGSLATKYLKGLDTQLNQAADAGDLKLVKVFREEKIEVQKLQKALAKHPADPVAAVQEKATLPPLPENAPTGLTALRKIWTAERKKIRGTLDSQLQQSLKSLEGQLTKARDFENAEKVLAYRESFGAVTPAVAATPKPSKKPAPSSGNTAMSIKSATKAKPFENSLGMRFVPVPITGGPSDGETVLFSIWETRVKDYEAFIKRNKEHQWQKADFKQEDDHPAVIVRWDDAQAFCEWLTKEDRRKGKLGKDERYRLPTDHEWSCAVGIGKEEDAEEIPQTKDSKIADIFPWGKKFPPPKGAGNYYGGETRRNPIDNRKPIEDYDDGFDRTAPVGSFAVNEYGLYDLGGNVWELCEDWFNPENKARRVLRGGSWSNDRRDFLLSSFRAGNTPTMRNVHCGFRCVLATNAPASKPVPVKAAVPKPKPIPGNTAMFVRSATKDKPYENILGMRFVPVPITGGPTKGKTVLFSIWETRVKDYEKFLKNDPDRPWQKADFLEDDHPAIGLSWEDAVAFCNWLTEQEREKGNIGKNESYRLPSDHEWSCAVGIGKRERTSQSPEEKSGKIQDVYPWGKEWPPPRDAGNYARGKIKDSVDDGFDRTAPVGSFPANQYGLFDMGGNSSEWCEDEFAEGEMVVRGGNWATGIPPSALLSSNRWGRPKSERNSYGGGFRVVLNYE